MERLFCFMGYFKLPKASLALFKKKRCGFAAPLSVTYSINTFLVSIMPSRLTAT